MGYDRFVDLVAEMLGVARALAGAGVRFAVCGGVAVTAHGAPRSTDDLDVLVHPDDVQAAIDAVRPLGYRFVALPMTFDAGSERERTVQRITKVEGDAHLVLDFLHAAGALAGMLSGTRTVQLPEGELTLVDRETLLRMKRLAGRPKDLADIEALEAGDE